MDCVITDALLQGLVYKSGTTELIPRLDFLALISLLGLTDALYIAVVASRVERHTTVHIDKSCIFESRDTSLVACGTQTQRDLRNTGQRRGWVSEDRLVFRSGAVSSSDRDERDAVEGRSETMTNLDLDF
ncbi:hypothetical protein B0H14DRAFT_3481985 [Mycena olivaceomarginata]|nr:hypothetical protein B0H14DRAFT_3481985 [Mycena olivaceomarginata]